MEKVDIIVLGAGPAGCAASIRCRQAGLSVVMFDANSEPKISPGETLHPGVEPLLKQLGVFDQILQAGFRRHRGIWLKRGDLSQFLPYGEDINGPWLGFQAERRTLHRILQQAAVDLEVRLIRKTRPEAVILEENRVTGVMVDGNYFHATWTVDATGRSAWLARELKLPAIICSPPLGVRFGWRNEEIAGFEGQPSLAFRFDGWDWQAPLAGNQTAWVELRIGELGEGSPGGVNLTWQWRSECAGPGFFLLGDAAATLDPSSSHGVLTALMSGIFFGHLVENYHRKGVNEAVIIEVYRKWLYLQFEQDRRRLRQHYANSPAGQRFINQSSY
ncbi:MAG: FAD-dependent oxidoreductase [Prochloraceae cyanobacterium]|nr:FAD-dependent oxidoreductase [Prochloraceae cyanobacterium]